MKSIGCMIITGSEKAFAAGADIGAMAKYSFADVYKGDYITRNWEPSAASANPSLLPSAALRWVAAASWP
jgi:enoyl-CoA hydratase